MSFSLELELVEDLLPRGGRVLCERGTRFASLDDARLQGICVHDAARFKINIVGYDEPQEAAS